MIDTPIEGDGEDGDIVVGPIDTGDNTDGSNTTSPDPAPNHGGSTAIPAGPPPGALMFGACS